MMESSRDDRTKGDENTESRETFASPPCLMHEFDQRYMGYLDHGQVIEFLNTLLEGARAGARILDKIGAVTAESGPREILRGVGRDEGYFCTMLKRQIERFGGRPGEHAGDLDEKVVVLEGAEARVDLFNRGQAWIVRKLDETLPKIRDDELHRELLEMRNTQVRNIERCEAISG